MSASEFAEGVRQRKLAAAQSRLAELISDHMPKEILEDAILAVAKAAVVEFRVEQYEVSRLLREIVDERAKTLLKTKYAKEIEALAEKAANIALQSMGR
jgi:uncharacterized protein YqeY